MEAPLTFGPQPGPQTDFLSTPADIAIYGGAAGGGKSYGLLLEPLRYLAPEQKQRGFAAVYFRREMTRITMPGGLLDQSREIYPHLGALLHTSPHPIWLFPLGDYRFRIRFAHLEYIKDAVAWMGSQIPMIAFDELAEFEEQQFWTLLARNRLYNPETRIRPYMRATTNPLADSWVAKLIQWWWDEATGYAIPERSGVIRWFVRVGDVIHWADHPDELAHHTTADGRSIPPKSLTFIHARLSDNVILTEADPSYEGNLLALNTVERERLLGNWKIKPAAGLFFRREWVDVIDSPPDDMEIVRGWDLAATREMPGTDPDRTVGVKLGRTSSGRIIVLHAIRAAEGPQGVRSLLHRIASADATTDGYNVRQRLPQDPAQAGKSQASDLAAVLGGFPLEFELPTGKKWQRFAPFSAQCEAGNVALLRGPWNSWFCDELEAFPPESPGAHDDVADATATAYRGLTERITALVGSYGYD